jgi:hypothetical protein
MPVNLTDDPTTFPTVVAPASADPRTAASVTAGLQPLANRTAYLKALATVGGVPRLAYVASLTALRAIAPSSVGEPDVRLVVNDSGMLGIYAWSSSSTAADDGIKTIEPSTSPASGRWLLADGGLWGVALGLVTLDSGARPAQVGHGASVAVEQAATSLSDERSTATYADLESPLSVSVPANGGDVIAIDYTVTGSTIGDGSTQIVVSENGGSFNAEPNSQQGFSGVTAACYSGQLLHTVAAAGTVIVKMQYKGDGTNNLILPSGCPRTLRATVYRP